MTVRFPVTFGLLLTALTLAVPALTGCQRGSEPQGSSRLDHPDPLSAGERDLPDIIQVSAEELSDGPAPKTAAPGAKEGVKENRLAKESSPYLLLHKHNPVDWYPWGPEAFETAKKLDRPIFLSVGYSSCYWCHVMERQVFSNPAIAAYMNEHFICVKVDREERPDIDDIYMTSLYVYLQLSGAGDGGGWPLSMFLTPDGRPLAGGTYFPPEDKAGQPGFPSIMKRIVEVWSNNREQVEKSADTVTSIVRREMRPALTLERVELNRALIDASLKEVVQSHDPEFGGLDFHAEQPDGPKFPVPVKLSLLQYELRSRPDADASRVLYHTLDSMAASGLRDHLSGGFHRYSTDRQWRVPHFEKMLYDNAQLAGVYAEAFRATGQPEYRTVAEETLAFVLTEMTDATGGFHSAIDAETDGVEGLYYVWSPEDVRRDLGPLARVFGAAYGLDQPSPFEHGHVLYRPVKFEQLAASLQMDVRDLNLQLFDARRRLLEIRNRRKSPLRDDKILTSWNALMIRSLAEAGAALERPQYVNAAGKAMLFVLNNLRDQRGQLLRTWREGSAKLDGTLDDYAFTIEALLTLHSVTQDEKWLNAARRLTDDQIAQFHDEADGGFYFTAHHQEALIARTKNAWDAVLPSGNSVTVRNLIRLTALTGNDRYRDLATKTLQLFAPQMKSHPRNTTNLAISLGEYLDTQSGSAPARPGAAPKESAAPPPAVPSEQKPPGQTPSGTSGAAVPTPGSGTGVTQASGEKPPSTAPKPRPDRITARAYLASDRLPAGGATRIAVIIEVAEGWHINASPAKPASAIPTAVSIDAKLGTALNRLQYPAGIELASEGSAPRRSVYEGRVVIFGELNAPPTAAGQTEEFQLSIRYQSCNGELCEQPRVVKFAARVPVAGPGEPVKAINAALFQSQPAAPAAQAPAEATGARP